VMQGTNKRQRAQAGEGNRESIAHVYQVTPFRSILD
jgi:hypothetical protein